MNNSDGKKSKSNDIQIQYSQEKQDRNTYLCIVELKLNLLSLLITVRMQCKYCMDSYVVLLILFAQQLLPSGEVCEAFML